jgi:hypothetical protein
MTDPQRMGTALTYARRYALFTLVGIAGEDDLDAPAPSRPAKSRWNSHSSQFTSAQGVNDASSARRSNSSPRSRPAPKPILSSEASSALREQLLASVAALNSTEALTDWAKDSMSAKNTLVDADVRAVQRAFEAKQSELGEPVETSIDSALNSAAQASSTSPAANDGVGGSLTRTARPRRSPRDVNHGEANSETHPVESPEPQRSSIIDSPAAGTRKRTAVDKSALTLDEPKRVRDKACRGAAVRPV